LWKEKEVKYQIVFDVGMGMTLPFPKKHIICLQITDKKFYSQPAKNNEDSCKAGYNMWSERVIANFTLPYGVIARIGKCFLILMNENKDTLCYKKFSAT